MDFFALSAQQFKSLPWYLSDVQTKVFSVSESEILFSGNVFLKLETHKESDEGDENLPLIWFQFEAAADINFYGSEIKYIQFYDEDDFGTNALGFCTEDRDQFQGAVKQICNSFDWQELVRSSIRNYC